MNIIPAAEEAILIQVADQQSESVLATIQWLNKTITDELGHLVTDLVPSFTTLMVYYNVAAIDYYRMRERLLKIVSGYTEQAMAQPARQIELPVYYDTDTAPDLERVASLTGLSAKQVIAAHQAQSYRVYALGFRPGFAFMGTLPAALQVPRLETPRQKIPSGSVALAEGQTSVYPAESPGGWNVIGNCPLTMFDRRGNEPTSLLRVGDEVTFTAISRAEFIALGGVVSVT